MSWIWKEVLEADYNNALKTKPDQIADSAAVAYFDGKHGEYHCTLTHCDCQQFTLRLKGKHPCKHIIALGLAVGAYDPAADLRRFEAEKIAGQLASAFGYYHLFHAPVMADAEYDRLKARYAALTEEKA